MFTFKGLLLNLRHTPMVTLEDKLNRPALFSQVYIKAKQKLNSFLNDTDYCEFKVIRHVIDKLPENSIFHVANSMVVRYLNGNIYTVRSFNDYF